jgi:hypothetical protein
MANGLATAYTNRGLAMRSRDNVAALSDFSYARRTLVDLQQRIGGGFSSSALKLLSEIEEAIRSLGTAGKD